MGLGNVDYGDDGFGVRLAEALIGADKPETSAEFLSSGGPSATFPLTPTLSLGERGNRLPSRDESRRCNLVLNRTTVLPLPKGEGWGEGNGSAELGPRHLLLNAGVSPERFIGRLAVEGFDHVIFLDAVEFGGAPGSVVLLDSQEMAARFPQVSTHKLSLGLLARQIEATGRTRAWLLGVQPGSLKPCDALTPAVQATLELLIELLTACLRERSPSRAGQRDLSPVATGAATMEVMA
ncbi:MAG TPA: hydrogenase maturation protease [Verrucomicrobiota bacterium]|nr:hydrogenase maturation protease [Verrucomicrobiota bacterium]